MKKIDKMVQMDIKRFYNKLPTLDEQRFRNLLKRVMEEADKRLEE